MLLAGIGLMGAVQDALTGFYLTSGARLIEAMMATAGIIAGVAVGISLADGLGIPLGSLVPGQLGRLDGSPPSPRQHCSPEPRCRRRRSRSPATPRAGRCCRSRSSPPSAALISQAIELSGFDRTMGAAAAAFFIGLVAYSVAGRVHVPPLVVAVPAIVPFLPGLSIYRGLTFLANGGYLVSQGILALMTAISVAIALASGVILGRVRRPAAQA